MGSLGLVLSCWLGFLLVFWFLFCGSILVVFTGHDRRLYNHDRSRPTTLYTFYTIIYSPQNTLKLHGRVL